MELPSPPTTRPAEHALRAHLAHGAHHGSHEEEQRRALEEAARKVSAPAPQTAPPARKPRARRKK